MGETVLFGRYRLVEAAGSGGSAQVWRAVDTESGEEVAVKRLHPVVFADEAARRRLEREFHALRALDEPHVVRVRDLRIDDDEAALILDYVPGPSLADRLAEGRPIEPGEAIAIARDVAAALAAAHAAGIVHRDVTPGNVLLEPGKGARLTDFGIAQGSVDAASVTVTAAGTLVGTLRYLAPEQLRGEPATPASDIHSLAAVTYEMLAGRPAYPATTPVSLAEAQARGPARIAGVSLALDEAVRRGLSPNPADRHPDVSALAEELLAALEDARTQVMTLPVAATAPVPAAAAAAMVSAAASPVPVAAVASSPGAATPPVAAPPPTPPVDPPIVRAGPPRGRSLPVPILALLAFLFGGLVLAAAIAPDRNAAATRTQPAVAVPAAPATSPSLEATPDPTPEPKDDNKGKGNGKGNGKGDDKGDD